VTTRRKAIVIAAVAVGVAAIVIANLRLSYQGAVGVEVAKVKTGPVVEKVSGPGVIYAESQVKISSSVMGRVTRLAVKEGSSVRAGDLLLEIDASQYRAGVNQAEASCRAAVARAELARANLEEARSEATRVQALAGSGLVSGRDVESATTSLAVAEAELRASEEAVGEGRATLAAAKDYLDKTIITAPISGTVTSLNVEQGEIVITGTMNNAGTVVMTISNLDTMEVRADIDETDVAKVCPGQEVEINVDAFADTTLSGVVSVVGSSSSSARSFSASSDERAIFEVRIRIINDLPGLRPGMATTVDITTAERDSVPYIPIQALVSREAGRGDAKAETEGVFTVEQSRARFAPLRTGISDAKNIEVLGGLEGGDDVVVGPFKVLRDLEDSTRVKATEAKE
jgi:HlyD family secretion protein